MGRRGSLGNRRQRNLRQRHADSRPDDERDDDPRVADDVRMQKSAGDRRRHSRDTNGVCSRRETFWITWKPTNVASRKTNAMDHKSSTGTSDPPDLSRGSVPFERRATQGIVQLVAEGLAVFFRAVLNVPDQQADC